MVAELWIVKMGSQVSSNLKQAILPPSKKPNHHSKSPNPRPDSVEPTRIGILSFEVANVMSKTVYLHKSLSDAEISRLKSEISASEGVRTLVSSDQPHLLSLVMAEKLDDLGRVAAVVSSLGKRCAEPALRGFQHVYGDIVSGAIEVRELGFLVRDMDSMVRRLERYVSSTSSLYGEMEVLNELEQATKKFQNNQHEESRKAFEQKLAWQRQDVRHLREVSLWNQTYDKVVELLARSVCTVYARIAEVFGPDPGLLKRCLSKDSDVVRKRQGYTMFRAEELVFPCGTVPGKLFMECLSLSSSVSRFEDDRADYDERSSQVSSSTTNVGSRREQRIGAGAVRFGTKSKLVGKAPATTVGGSALALHYANVIIVIEKLLQYPHLVGEEARDDLYRMLPTSLRLALRASLKSCAKSLAIYDAPLAHDWKETLDGVLRWLAPLAHNMIRWQSERNFEQHQIVARTNVLLVQTLYFADREKTEAAICRLLVGLNYICRYEQQQNALLDCASSFDFEDCVEWQLQCRAAYGD